MGVSGRFFELDGKHVLLTSPQDMLPEGLEFHNGNGTLCIIGEMDPETHTLKEETVQKRRLWNGLLCNADFACTGWP